MALHTIRDGILCPGCLGSGLLNPASSYPCTDCEGSGVSPTIARTQEDLTQTARILREERALAAEALSGLQALERLVAAALESPDSDDDDPWDLLAKVHEGLADASALLDPEEGGL